MDRDTALALGRLNLPLHERVQHQLAGIAHNFKGAGGAGLKVAGEVTSIDRGDLTLAGAPASTVTVIEVGPDKPRHTFIGAATGAADINVTVEVRVARQWRQIDAFTLTAGAAATQRPELRVGANGVRVTATGVGATTGWFIWSSLAF